jgi:hypothetical protein
MTAADEAGRSAAPLASPSRASVTSCGRFASFEDWRRDYNEVRPHSALENRTPLEFATSLQGAGIPAPCPGGQADACPSEPNQPQLNPIR